MALTGDQKSNIRRYLGVPDISRQYDLRLESAMDALSPEGETRVVDYLRELELIRAQLEDARACRLKVKQVVGEVILGHEDEIRTLWREGNRISRDLGVALYFHLRRMPFGTGGPNWSSGGSGTSYVMNRG